MTHAPDAALRRDLLARWCTLAEQRLQHLIDLFESGRWRRYYSERAFIENIREAKQALETWRALSGQGADTQSSGGGLQSNLRHVDFGPDPELSKRDPMPDTRRRWRASAPASDDVEDSDAPRTTERLPRQLNIDLVALEAALMAPPPAADVAAVERRYPVLRNAML